jgi:citrate synthase
MNGLFMIARVPGLIAHVREEQTRMKPMRNVVPGGHEYDGPEARTLS